MLFQMINQEFKVLGTKYEELPNSEFVARSKRDSKLRMFAQTSAVYALSSKSISSASILLFDIQVNSKTYLLICHSILVAGTFRPNGCSIPGGLPFPYKKVFTPACNSHDYCYHYVSNGCS